MKHLLLALSMTLTLPTLTHAGVDQDRAWLNAKIPGLHCSQLTHPIAAIIITSSATIRKMALSDGHANSKGKGLFFYRGPNTRKMYLSNTAGPHIRVHEVAHSCGIVDEVQAHKLSDEWKKEHSK